MISFKLDSSYDVIPTDNENGYKTLSVATFPESISQLVPLIIYTDRKGRPYEPEFAIDWSLYLGENLDTIDENLLNLFSTQLSALISSINGIENVNLSQATIDERTLELSNVCFTINCNEYTL